MAVELAPRHLAVLRAVAAGRAELTCSCEPDLYVDGRCCTDHSIAGLLCRAGLITAQPPTGSRRPADGRLPAGLTPAGHALMKTPRPGGSSLRSLRRVGSPNTQQSGEEPMLFSKSTRVHPDCAALGHDWDWGTEPGQCGRPHTFRICARCLLAEDPVCSCDDDTTASAPTSGTTVAGVAA